MANGHFRLIDSPSGLTEVVDDALAAKTVGMDTEFRRVRTYYPQPALYQIQACDRCYLVDPVAIKDMTPLRALLQAPDVKKVMHGCHEDMVLFDFHLGLRPKALFDTQIAAAFIGFHYPIGYQGLVSQLLDISLSKSERRSNWLRRPLSKVQQSYAAADVHYLLPLHDWVIRRLKESGRYEWFKDEIQYLFFSESPPESSYRRYVYAWKLQESTLLRFQKLWQWREKIAQNRNKPRQFIVNDKVLYQLAKQDSPDAVLKESPNIRKRYGDKIRQLIHEADIASDSLWPEPVAGPLRVSENDLLKRLQLQVRQLSERLNLPEGFLANKKMLTGLIVALRDQLPSPEWLNGWRGEIIDKPFVDRIVGEMGY